MLAREFWLFWSQELDLAPGFHSLVTIWNLEKLQYKRFKAICTQSEISCCIQKINFLYNFILKIGLTFWQLRAKPMAYFVWPWCQFSGYSAQTINKCIDYELESADNPYALTKFCKLLSLTYYKRHTCQYCVLMPSIPLNSIHGEIQ